MPENPVVYAADGDVVTVTLNRPDKRNAFNRAMLDELSRAFERAAEEEARVVVLGAAGTVFSAGADLAEMQRLQTASYEENLEESRRLAALLKKMRASPFVIIAAVQGHAIAGGAGLVAASDIVVAAAGAEFGFTEVNIGFIPAIVATFVLRRMNGSDARDLLLTGRRVEARAAMAMGLVNAVAEADSLGREVDRYARLIADRTSGQAVAATKRLIDDLWGKPLDESLELAAVSNAVARETDDCRAGVAAFLDREDPPWRKR